MSKSDQEAIIFVVLFLAGVAIFALVLWLIDSTIRFLNDNRFVYGLIVGVCVGIVTTFGGIALVTWWRDRQG